MPSRRWCLRYLAHSFDLDPGTVNVHGGRPSRWAIRSRDRLPAASSTSTSTSLRFATFRAGAYHGCWHRHPAWVTATIIELGLNPYSATTKTPDP